MPTPPHPPTSHLPHRHRSCRPLQNAAQSTCVGLSARLVASTGSTLHADLTYSHSDGSRATSSSSYVRRTADGGSIKTGTMAAPTSTARQKKLKKKLKKTPKLDPGRCPDPKAMTAELDYWVSAWLSPMPAARHATSDNDRTMGVRVEAPPRRKSPHYARPSHHISRHRPKIKVNYVNYGSSDDDKNRRQRSIKIFAICIAVMLTVMLLGFFTAKGTFLVVKQGMRGAPIRRQA